MILLIDVLNLMNDVDVNGRPVPFAIKYKTVEAEEVIIESAIKCIGKEKGKILYDKNPKKSKQKKDPNHFKNATRNIYIPISKQIRKCKIRLITEFNGQKVVY